MLLEQLSTGDSVFVTLTYRPEDMPVAADRGPCRPDEGHLGIVEKDAFQRFMKRLRKRLPGRKLRYVGVGEYGDRGWRPHYHAIIYGLHQLEAHHVEAAWPHGFVKVDEANADRMMYLAGYATKKLSSAALRGRKSGAFVERRLRGRPPEFMVYSRNLGFAAHKIVSAQMMTKQGARALAATRDAPGDFRQYGRRWPFDRRFRNAVREELGVPTEATQRALAGVPAGCSFTPERLEAAKSAEARLHQRARSRRTLLDFDAKDGSGDLAPAVDRLAAFARRIRRRSIQSVTFSRRDPFPASRASTSSATDESPIPPEGCAVGVCEKAGASGSLTRPGARRKTPSQRNGPLGPEVLTGV